MSTCMLTHNIPDGSNVQSMLKSKVLGLLAIYLYIIYIYIYITYIRTVHDFNPYSNIDVGMYSFCGPCWRTYSISYWHILAIGYILAIHLHLRVVQRY